MIDYDFFLFLIISISFNSKKGCTIWHQIKKNNAFWFCGAPPVIRNQHKSHWSAPIDQVINGIFFFFIIFFLCFTVTLQKKRFNFFPFHPIWYVNFDYLLIYIYFFLIYYKSVLIFSTLQKIYPAPGGGGLLGWEWGYLQQASS